MLGMRGPLAAGVLVVAGALLISACASSSQVEIAGPETDAQQAPPTTAPVESSPVPDAESEGETPSGQEAEPTAQQTTAPAADPTATGGASATTEPTVTPRPAQLQSDGSNAPPGVAESFEWIQVGNGICTEFRSTDPVGVFASPEMNLVAEGLLVCLPGFSHLAQTSVVVTAPSGESFEIASPSRLDLDEYDGVAFVLTTVGVFAETGQYQITAEQGSLQARNTFGVMLPSREKIDINRSGFELVVPGESIEASFSGFPANTVPEVHVYAAGENSIWSYVSTFDGPRTDSQGRALFELMTQPSDSGSFCLAPAGGPTPGSCVEFFLGGAPANDPSVGACSASGEPTAPFYRVTGVSEDDPDGGLIMHEGAGDDTGYRALIPWNKGDVIVTGKCEQLQSGAVWWQIKLPRIGFWQRGWVNATYLAASAPSCALTQYPVQESYRVIDVAPDDIDGGLVVHSAPGVNTPEIGVLAWDARRVRPRGGCEAISGRPWWEIEFESGVGWVSARFLGP